MQREVIAFRIESEDAEVDKPCRRRLNPYISQIFVLAYSSLLLANIESVEAVILCLINRIGIAVPRIGNIGFQRRKRIH